MPRAPRILRTGHQRRKQEAEVRGNDLLSSSSFTHRLIAATFRDDNSVGGQQNSFCCPTCRQATLERGKLAEKISQQDGRLPLLDLCEPLDTCASLVLSSPSCPRSCPQNSFGSSRGSKERPPPPSPRATPPSQQ